MRSENPKRRGRRKAKEGVRVMKQKKKIKENWIMISVMGTHLTVAAVALCNRIFPYQFRLIYIN